MANIQLNFDLNVPGPMQPAITIASQQWENLIQNNTNILINVFYQDLSAVGLAALCIPNAATGFPNQPTANTWYPSALADALAQQDLQVGAPDLDLYFSSVLLNGQTWWNSPVGGPNQATELDLYTTALHEICHGLGFVSLSKVNPANSVGSFGRILVGDLPVVPSFLFPNFNGNPSVLDRLMRNVNAPLTYLPNDSLLLFQTMQAAVQFRTAVPNDLAVYAPNLFALFSSLNHFDPTIFPNSLMIPSLPCGMRRQVDQPTIEILRTIGWTI